ncbi:hypothetical protein EVU96_07595 [Bacillus infantis]|uniref:hypothetical protein n=1 Tax=Bacillus infantis TaxID=324767 RepID=UPI00101D9D9B|nr:hypothetical protein [Bacillus infantis]RYI30275.1 hypothetical protein EVU96_07595 [Bacillus infantis]
MTYCFAWKSDNEIYIVADSLTSTKNSEDEVEADCSSMGEKYGEYNSYFVAETDIKIYIKEHFVIAFSGNIDIFREIKGNLNLMVDYLSNDQIIKYLQEILGDAEIILAIMHKKNSELFLLNKNRIKIINDFVSIGSGRSIGALDNVMKNFSRTFPDFSNENIDDIPRKKISAATAYLQLISLSNNFLEYGVGGTVSGVCIYDSKIEWTDDLLYFFYDEKLKNKKLINVLIRNDTILTGSDFTGLTKLFRSPEAGNELDEVSIRKIRRSMNKNMSSHIPRYVVFFSKELNNVYFYDTKRKTQTMLVRMFQRRSKEKIRWEIFTMDILVSRFLLNNNNIGEFETPFHYLEGLPVSYALRDNLIEKTENIEDIEFEYDKFDFPLENIQINISKIENYFKFNLEEYENLIIVNFDYLESKIIELRNFYKGLNVQFDSTSIIKGLIAFLEKKWGVNKFEILIFSKKYQFLYEKIDGLEFNLVQDNKEFALFSNKLLHNYYTDPKYFHLNKILIIDDSSYFNELFEILPEYNKYEEEADIFIIKNQNRESKVLHAPFYYNADIIFSRLAGLSQEAMSLWNPAEYTNGELIKIQKYLNEQIEHSKV